MNPSAQILTKMIRSPLNFYSEKPCAMFALRKRCSTVCGSFYRRPHQRQRVWSNVLKLVQRSLVHNWFPANTRYILNTHTNAHTHAYRQMHCSIRLQNLKPCISEVAEQCQAQIHARIYFAILQKFPEVSKEVSTCIRVSQ